MKPLVSKPEEFKRDLEIGNNFEKKCAELIRHKTQLPEAPISFCNNKAYDFEINGAKFEVKCDQRASQTGNLAFEWSSRGRPSGIALRDADTWIHGVGKDGEDGILYATLSTVRNQVLQAFYEGKAKFMPNLGDGTSGFLVKVEVAKEFMCELTDK